MTIPQPQQRSFLVLQMLALLLAVVACVVTGALFGYRRDILQGWAALPIDFSIVMSFCVLFLLASLCTLRLAAGSVRADSTYIGFFLVVLVVVLTMVLVEVAVTPPHILKLSLLAHHPLQAIGVVTAYGLVGAVCLLAALRLHRPASPDRAAVWAGISATLAGALGYTVHSQSDSALFYVIAFGVPCLLVGSAAAVLAPVLMRRAN